MTSRSAPRPSRGCRRWWDLVHLAVERVPRARWASLTVLRGRRFRTEATSDDGATKADILQYDMGFGPCVDAVLADSVYVSGDVATTSGGWTGARGCTTSWGCAACSPSGCGWAATWASSPA